VNLTLHFIRARSNLILSCSSRSSLLYYATYGVMEGKKRIVSGGGGGEGGGEIGQSSLIGRIVFHILFML